LKVHCSSHPASTLTRLRTCLAGLTPSLLNTKHVVSVKALLTSDFLKQRTLPKARVFIALAVFASGCSTLPTQGVNTPPKGSTQSQQQTKPSADLSVAAPKVQETPDFEPETLFDLIIAEMAGKQNRLDVTLGNYLKQAHRTNDPKIAARAARIAKYMNAHQATLDATKLWLAEEPDNTEALQMMTVQLIRAGEFEKALSYMERLLEQKASANFDFLVQHSQEITRRRRQGIITALEDIIKRYPSNPQLLFTKALLLQQNEDLKEALVTTNSALEIDPNYVSAIIFKAQLLHKQNKSKEAAALLRRAARKHQKHKQLGIVYARVLIEQGELKQAHKQFKRLVNNFPNDYDLLLSLALISWENELADQAVSYLNQLIELEHRQDEAYTYLAQIAEAQGETEKTIALFRKVNLGPHFANAQIQMARLYAYNQDMDTAREILGAARNLQPQQSIHYYINEAELLAEHHSAEEVLAFYDKALEKFPNDANILYSRAMFHIKADDIESMEKDLRLILSDNPTNPLALNALGYTLADRTDRLEEALELIQKAIALRPDDPAVMDSLGWVYFKLGQTETALQYLQRAYAMLKDHEIAAHLGEALWSMGKKSEAIRIWKKALEHEPDSEVIRETMGRLRP